MQTMSLDDDSSIPLQRSLHSRRFNAGSGDSTDQNKTAQILQVNAIADESSNLVQQPHDHGSEYTPAGSLTKKSYERWIVLCGDVLLSLTPLLFLIMASLSLYLNHQARTAFGDKVRAMASLSPTIFPIVYAAIIGTVLRRISLYQAERGASLGTIERMTGCYSLFTAFKTQIGLRRLDLLGISLLVVWILSPLGGQASLRLLEVTPREMLFNSTVLYYPLEAYSVAPMILSGSDAFSYWPFYAAPYMTALETSKQTINSSMDLWRNVKMPDIKSLQGYRMDTPASQWYNISDKAEVTYASLLGIPIVGIPESGNMSFHIESFYWSVECNAAKIDPVRPWKPTAQYINTTSLASQTVYTFNLAVNSSARNTASLTYQSRKSDNLAQTNTSSAECIVEAPIVEAYVECVNRNCGVRGIRKLSRSHNFASGRSPASLFLQTSQLGGADLGATQRRPRQSQPTELFIAGRETKAAPLGEEWVEIADIHPKVLSNRLQAVINTFWDASIGNSLRTANLTVEYPPSVCPLDYSKACTDKGVNWNTTTLHGKRFEGEQYTCDIRFAIIVVVISFFLLLAANVSTFLGTITIAPDILGYVSTAARDNPYFKSCEVPSYFDGMGASRIMQDVKIMIGDVEGKAEFGHVALVPMEVLPQRVTRKKFYQ